MRPSSPLPLPGHSSIPASRNRPSSPVPPHGSRNITPALPAVSSCDPTVNRITQYNWTSGFCCINSSPRLLIAPANSSSPSTSQVLGKSPSMDMSLNSQRKILPWLVCPEVSVWCKLGNRRWDHVSRWPRSWLLSPVIRSFSGITDSSIFWCVSPQRRVSPKAHRDAGARPTRLPHRQ